MNIQKICCIRTGGQNGVDRAAMDVARQYHISLCGWCPKDGWAEDYPAAPGLRIDYPELTETPSPGTDQRTRWNMRDTDAVLTIIPEGSETSSGTILGLEVSKTLRKPMFTASGSEDIPDIINWLHSLPDGVDLCIGGPRPSECPYAYDTATAILSAIIEHFFALD